VNTETLTDSKKRVLAAAERHFMERGFAAVTLQDVADELAIKQASLYYHAPGGKQDLFEQVVRFALLRHARGIESALARADNTARDQCEEVLAWLTSQPPLPVMRLIQADLPELDEDAYDELEQLARRAVVAPVRDVFRRATDRGEIRSFDPDLLARAFFTLVVDSAQSDVEHVESEARAGAANQLLDIFFEGIIA
jgi:AcrR family transcriptional regulator